MAQWVGGLLSCWVIGSMQDLESQTAQHFFSTGTSRLREVHLCIVESLTDTLTELSVSAWCCLRCTASWLYLIQHFFWHWLKLVAANGWLEARRLCARRLCWFVLIQLLLMLFGLCSFFQSKPQGIPPSPIICSCISILPTNADINGWGNSWKTVFGCLSNSANSWSNGWNTHAQHLLTS